LLDAAPAQVVAQRLTGPGGEQAVKVIGREVRQRRQRREVERLIEALVDGLDDPMHAPFVFVAGVDRRHGTTLGWTLDCDARTLRTASPGIGSAVPALSSTQTCKTLQIV
jgi:hypothetical protein